MINNIVLTGRLTKDVDLRYTSTGTAVGSFTLAVDRKFKGQNGEKETDFINCIIWRKAAETFAEYTKKGLLVGIQGRIQTRTYDNQQGQRVYVTEVVVENFTFLEFKNAKNGPQSDFQASAPDYSDKEYNQHLNERGIADDPFLSSGQTIDISDDDLPF